MEFYTDLIADCAKELNQGTKITQQKAKDVTISEIIIDENAEIILGKRRGRYITFEFQLEKFDKSNLISLITKQLKDLLSKEDYTNVMIVGLGNETLIADKFGVLVSKQVDVSQKNNKITITSIAPSVEGLTGIDSKVILDLLINKVKPQLIIMVDALMTKSFYRLNSTVQISDAPLDFGRGTQNKRKILTDIINNVSVISIGFPTTITAESIIKENNEKINRLLPKNASLLQNDYDNVVVAPAEGDYMIHMMADVISQSINNAIALIGNIPAK